MPRFGGRIGGQDGAMKLASVGVLLGLIVAGVLVLKHPTYTGVTFGAHSSTPSAVSGAAQALTKTCSDMANLGIQRVDLMQRLITSLRADHLALVNAGDQADAAKVKAVITAAVSIRGALKTGADTTALQQTLLTASSAVPC